MDEQRFWENVDRSGGPDACWPWLAASSNGYGAVSYEGRMSPSHRVAYTLLVGPIPEGLVIDHLCRNPPCQNPKHLEPVTQAENVRRGDSGKMWAAKTHCPRGHPYSGENLYITITGGRACRICGRAHRREYKARVKEKMNAR